MALGALGKDAATRNKTRAKRVKPPRQDLLKCTARFLICKNSSRIVPAPACLLNGFVQNAATDLAHRNDFDVVRYPLMVRSPRDSRYAGWLDRR
jgi:hypothetical protein